MRPRLCAAALIALVAAAGCRSDARAAACASDRAQVQQLVDEDKRIDKLLHQADVAASKGQGAEAASLITSRAAPSEKEVLQRARGWNPASRWGRDIRAEMIALIEARSKSMTDYADALRSDDLKRVVEQMEAQHKLEQRAVELEAKLAAAACSE
ncbi:MAG: hypothetical protein HY898_10990 [Deltaproteobacteria bacterium]|nr:hypothetical protein [Deltaproteobacteria bacterium]